jgi:hypothetical protein
MANNNTQQKKVCGSYLEAASVAKSKTGKRTRAICEDESDHSSGTGARAQRRVNDKGLSKSQELVTKDLQRLASDTNSKSGDDHLEPRVARTGMDEEAPDASALGGQDVYEPVSWEALYYG